MNQDQVKELLKKLRPSAPDFSVIYSGKASRKVNGLYKPESWEILLHNRNFNSDQELIYTAIHEFAHHLHSTSDQPPKGNRCHTKAFWLIFHGLITEAIEAGIYVPVLDRDLAEGAAQVRSCMKAEAEALKATGKALTSLVQLCGKAHVRFEDYLDRVLGISRKSAQVAMTAFATDLDTSGGADQLRLVSTIRDPEVRREVELTPGSLIEKQAIAKGVMRPAPAANPVPLRSKEAERARLESKLARLEEEVEEVRTRLQGLEGAEEGTVAHPADKKTTSKGRKTMAKKKTDAKPVEATPDRCEVPTRFMQELWNKEIDKKLAARGGG